MIERFHGIDRHKQYSTVSVKNREGKEIAFIARCENLTAYIETLGPCDAVVIEASTGSFYWADLIELRGGVCYVLNPFKFKIIRESWNKCDKQDCRNMSTALWVYLVTDEFGLPTVHKPEAAVRELRKLFAQYQLLTCQATQLKNNLQAILCDNGVTLSAEKKKRLLDERYASETLGRLQMSVASRLSIEIALSILWKVAEQKKKLRDAIIAAGAPFEDSVKILITIRGITAFLALAFLADIGDVQRFKTLRKMNAYLGLVQKAKQSGDKNLPRGINRQSRKLTRTLLTQSVPHITAASPELRRYYAELRARRGVGRARIAVIRKICGVMRRMLLEGTEFRDKDPANFERKLKEYEALMRRIQTEPKSA